MHKIHQHQDILMVNEYHELDEHMLDDLNKKLLFIFI